MASHNESRITRLHVAPVRAALSRIDAGRNEAVGGDGDVDVVHHVGNEIVGVGAVFLRLFFLSALLGAGGHHLKGFGIVKIVRCVVAGDALVVVGAHGRHQFQGIVGYDVRDVVEVLDEPGPHPVKVFPILRLVVPHEDGVGPDVFLVVEKASVVMLSLLVVSGDLLAFLGESREEPGPAEIHGVPGEETGVLHFVDALGIVAVAFVVAGYRHVDEAGPESGLDFFLRDLEIHGPHQKLIPVFLDLLKFPIERFRILHEVQHGADRRPVRGSVGHQEN